MRERSGLRKFGAATGHTPDRLVEAARLDAARLLLSRGQSLKDVAVEVALSPPAWLTEAFAWHRGVAPRWFRDMHAEF